MKLLETLLQDLERQYHFGGKPEKKAKVAGLIFALGNARFLPVLLQRLSHALYRRKLKFLAKGTSLLNFLFFGIEIGTQCEIGPGLYFPHTIGTVLGAFKIGRNAVIYHQVTIGAKEMDLTFTAEKRPIVGDNVIIGSGAKVLGGITIGHNVTIGANAVVTQSVPDNVVVGGIPARILKENPGRARDLEVLL
jgi:serine O-acetyltransferase